MSDKLHQAIELAYQLHCGQRDKAGNPYLFHLIYVALQQDNEVAKIAALLHDSVEDGLITLKEIQNQFGGEIGTVVSLLTRSKEETYAEYIDRIAVSRNKAAISVKLADLEHNMQTDRFPEMSEKYISLQERYKKAHIKLKNCFK